MPSGTTVSFNPNPIPAPGSGSSTMTITVGASTPVGTYPITVTGNGGGIQQNTTVTLTVTAHAAELHHFSLAGFAQRPAGQSRDIDDHDDHQRRLQQRDQSVGVGHAVGDDGELQSQPDTGAGLGQLDHDHHGGGEHADGNLSHHGDGQRRRHPAEHDGHADGDVAVGSWQQGFDFRNTADFVTDPPGDTYVLATTAYPTQGNGVTYGWVKTSLVQGRDRNAKLDPRLAGINFATNGSPATFYVDLPSAGTYNLSLAMGDAGYQACWVQCQVQFLDGSTVLATVTEGSINLGYFYDAKGNNWSAAAWPSEQPQPAGDADGNATDGGSGHEPEHGRLHADRLPGSDASLRFAELHAFRPRRLR